MKVRSNPAHSPSAVMYPFLRGVYVGAVVDHEETAKRDAFTFKFSDEPVDLLAEGETILDFQKKHPHEYAYFCKKCQEGELLAADAEMAKAAGVELTDVLGAHVKDEHGKEKLIALADEDRVLEPVDLRSYPATK